MRRELARKALGLHPYEAPERVEALLELIDLGKQDFIGCTLPDGNFTLPEEDCLYCRPNGKCWLNMPDSEEECKGTCSSFTLQID